MQYTLTNSFHNTEVTVRTRNGRLSERQLRKVHKTLCGMDDCHCNTFWDSDWAVEETRYGVWEIVPTRSK